MRIETNTKTEKMETYRYGASIDTWGITSFRVQKRVKSFWFGTSWETISSWGTSKKDAHAMLDLVKQIEKQGHIIYHHTPDVSL